MNTLDKIIHLLKEQNKKQIDLCEHIGVKKNAFTSWKAGVNHSYKKHIDKIAEFLGVSTDYLLGVEYTYDFSPIKPTILTFSSDAKTPFEIPKDAFVATNNEKKMIIEYRTKPEKQRAINNILNSESVSNINDEALMFALWGGDTTDITPEMLADVRKFAQFIREKKKDDSQ